MSENGYVVLLPSAGRTTAVSSPAAPAANAPILDSHYYKNFGATGILVILDVTVASGSGGLSVKIEAVDLVSGKFVTLNPAAVAVIATGTTTYLLYPSGGTDTAVTLLTNGMGLPLYWRVSVGVGDASSYTYSLSAFLLH